MKKTILGLVLALTTNVAVSNDISFKSRVISVVATGLDTTKNVIGAGYEISRNAANKVSGSTFIGNNKLNIFYAVAASYACTEAYNWKTGKELRTAQAYKWTASSWLGVKTACILTTFTSWFTKKTVAVKQQLALAEAQVEALNSLDTKTLANKTELATVSQAISDLDTTVGIAIAGIQKTLNNLNIDPIKTDILSLQNKMVSKDAFIQSQNASIQLFATNEALQKLTTQVDNFETKLKDITETLSKIAAALEKSEQTTAPTKEFAVETNPVEVVDRALTNITPTKDETNTGN